jgi:hypothetical protein
VHGSPQSPLAPLFASFRQNFDLLFEALSARRRGLGRLRDKWGRPGDKDGKLAGRFFELTRDASPSVVDDKTWTDLEFPRIFADIDSTESPLGSQYLYRQLRTYVESPEALAIQLASCEQLRAEAGLREEIQLRLSDLDAEANAYLANFIYGKPPAVPEYLRWMPWWSLACVALVPIDYLASLPASLCVIVLGINAVLNLRLSLQVSRETDLLSTCGMMLRTAEKLAAVPAPPTPLPQLQRLSEDAPLRARARKALGWLTLLQSPLIQPIVIWLNLFFLANLSATSHAVRRMARVRPELAATFEAVGALDAAIAVASFLEGHPDRCAPRIVQASLLEIVDGTHPLVRKPVANSIRLDGRSALVTGSNMAGKTTFIKMAGINLILGRTLGLCLASRATLPDTPVMASIRGEHSVESGKSHYFAEMEAVQGFIEGAKQGRCRLFLIDELFNGTNTVERLAAGRAVLESLGAHAQALVTTHDVELQDDVAHLYDLYYFQEDPDVEGFFDYRLRPGRTTRRNAIRLLARNGFPADVVDKALEYSEHYARVAGATA